MEREDSPSFEFDEEERTSGIPGASSLRTETIDLGAFNNLTTSGSYDLSDVHTSTLGKLLNSLPIPAFIINRSYQIIFANKSSGVLCGESKDSPGSHSSSLFPSGGFTNFQSLGNSVFANRKARSMETMLEVNRERIWGRVHVLSVRLGIERAVLMLVEDLTPQKKQLLLKRKHEAELRKAHEKLERKVEQRTAELQKTNERLMAEMAQRKQVEDSLTREERFSATVIDCMPGIFYLFDHRGKLLRWNKNFEQVSGYSAEEISTINPPDLFAGENERTFEKAIQEALIQGESAVEAQLISKDGHTTPYLFSGRRVTFGDTTCVVGMGIDVTDRVRTANALIESETKYRTLFETAGDGILIMEAEGATPGKILSANPAAAETHGYTQEELLRLNLADLKSPGVPVNLKELMWQLLRGETFREEVVNRKKDGSPIYLEVNARPLTLQGRKYMLTIDRDITERKLAENALKESEERMRLVIESSPIGIGIVQEGKCQFVNPNFAKMFGYSSPEDLVGLPAESLFVIEERQAVVRHMRAATAGWGARSFELPGQKSDGGVFQVSTWLATIDYKGKPSLLWFAIDISQETALRSQLLQAQKMEAIGTLAGGIAHDFNNLLTVILGFSEILLMDRKEADRDYADLLKIVQAARNGADLVRRILTFSRKVETKLRPMDLNHEVKHAQKLLNRTIPKMIEIELALDTNLKKINGDPGQIEQILLNLAVNAQHAMPEGGRLLIETKTVHLDELYCQTQIDVNPGEHALLMVSDTGCGIEKNILEHIFEPFFSTKRQGEGTGLGLAMVFGIIRSHGGHITCYSEPGVGTAFKIYFPVIGMPQKLDVDTLAELPPSGTETVLLVDDEEFVRDLGRRIMVRAGYQVLTASNGMEAIDAYRANKDQISLVLLDIIMPQMGGRQCLEEMVKIDPNVRVIVASGFSVDDLAKGDLNRRVRGFVNKPFRVMELLKVMREVIDSDQ